MHGSEGAWGWQQPGYPIPRRIPRKLLGGAPELGVSLDANYHQSFILNEKQRIFFNET